MAIKNLALKSNETEKKGREIRTVTSFGKQMKHEISNRSKKKTRVPWSKIAEEKNSPKLFKKCFYLQK